LTEGGEQSSVSASSSAFESSGSVAARAVPYRRRQGSAMMSLVIPVYRNAENVAPLLAALEELAGRLRDLEVVFVVDGSPDDSHLQLLTSLPRASFSSQLLLLSRNFGTFAAMRAGLTVARGDLFAVMTADLQEPAQLIVDLFASLRDGAHDLAVGQRTGRSDPWLNRLSAAVFWRLYRRFVLPELPTGGVDIFACQRSVRDQILALRESNTSLIALLFWVGYRRATVPYVRLKREAGRSSWTLRKRLRYLADSVFGFTDLPLRLLFHVGWVGVAVSIALGLMTLLAKLTGNVPIPGYAATLLTVVFFGALNCLGLGTIGGYVWRTFENSKERPSYIVANHQVFPGKAGDAAAHGSSTAGS
jgi:glycosyltransferase involved in cell wall biosynthesis